MKNNRIGSGSLSPMRKRPRNRGKRRLNFEPLEARRLLAQLAEFDLTTLLPENGGDGTLGFTVNGIDGEGPDLAIGDLAGDAVSSAGDVNGDGIGDLIIGAVGRANRFGCSPFDPFYEFCGIFVGEAYVVFGQDGGLDPTTPLSSLDGTNGFVISAAIPLSYLDLGSYFLGNSVSGAGDVNGDGYDDVIVGASQSSFYDPVLDTIISPGVAHVIFGGTDFPADLNVADLDGTNGFTIKGIDDGDEAGDSVSGAGDVNGDGYDDVILGAPFAETGGINVGKAYVVFGSGDEFDAELDLATLDGSNGFLMDGASGFCGGSVSGAGDVNNDGYGDVLVGCHGADPNGKSFAGETFLVYGSDSFGASVDLSTLNGTDGYVIRGIDPGDQSGGALSDAGDINGDGFDDFAIGARYAERTGYDPAGETYFIFGKLKDANASLELSSLDGTNGFLFRGLNPGDRTGWSVNGAGDINGDGFDDVLSGTRWAGNTHVIFGRPGPFDPKLEAFSLEGTNGLVLHNPLGERAGYAVSDAGDVNGDGIDDVVVGAAGANQEAGRAYVVYGGDFATEPSANDMYVWDIAFEQRSRGKGGSVRDGRVRVTVRRDSDADGVAEETDELVSGVTVTVNVSGPQGGTFSGIARHSGVYTVRWNKLSNLPPGTYTAEVIGLSHETYKWAGYLDPTASDTDSDADWLPDEQLTIDPLAAAGTIVWIAADEELPASPLTTDDADADLDAALLTDAQGDAVEQIVAEPTTAYDLPSGTDSASTDQTDAVDDALVDLPPDLLAEALLEDPVIGTDW